ASAFVAQLIGSARTLAAHAEGRDAVRLATGELLPAALVGAAAGAVTLCARADQGVLGEGPAQAEVDAAAGRRGRLGLARGVGEGVLAALVDPASAPVRGERVRCTLRGARAFAPRA